MPSYQKNFVVPRRTSMQRNRSNESTVLKPMMQSFFTDNQKSIVQGTNLIVTEEVAFVNVSFQLPSSSLLIQAMPTGTGAVAVPQIVASLAMENSSKRLILQAENTLYKINVRLAPDTVTHNNDGSYNFSIYASKTVHNDGRSANSVLRGELTGQCKVAGACGFKFDILKMDLAKIHQRGNATQKDTTTTGDTTSADVNADNTTTTGNTTTAATTSANTNPNDTVVATCNQGEAGPVGPRGQTGKDGRNGANGVDGRNGQDGVTGPQGPQGCCGPQGPAGESGSQGPIGMQGPFGAQGCIGIGIQGPRGVGGPVGPVGTCGSEGPQGAQGMQGIVGPRGPAGACTCVTEDEVKTITGPAGPQGAQGTAGPRGPQGVKGETGDQGATGVPGVQGAPGECGCQGVQGPTGATGPAGPAGSVSINGAGLSGANLSYSPSLTINKAIDSKQDAFAVGNNLLFGKQDKILTLNLNTTLSGLTSVVSQLFSGALSCGSGATTGVLKPGYLNLRKDSTSDNVVRDLLYLNNSGTASTFDGDVGISYRNYSTNFATRYRKDKSFAFGTTPGNTGNGVLTSYFEIDPPNDQIRMFGNSGPASVERFKFDLAIGALSCGSYAESGLLKPGYLNLRKDSTSDNVVRDLLYLNNSGTASTFDGDVGISYRNYSTNFATRYRKDKSFAFGTTPGNTGNGVLTSYFEIDPPSDKIRMIGKPDGQASVERFMFDLEVGTLKITSEYRQGTTHALIDFFMNDNTIDSGRIQYNGSQIQYIGTSDIRLKQAISPITNHFEVLDKLNPVSYAFKANPNKIVDGFIADEMYETYRDASCGLKPGALNEDGTPDYLGIDTKALIPILTQSIKGNRKQIQQLELENGELKKKNYDMEDRIHKMELQLNLIYEKLNISYI